MNTRIEVIQKLINDNGYTRYLEIGYGSGECFRAIECKEKLCIDPHVNAPGVAPMASDDFFRVNETLHPDNKVYDIIFIDGLHHAEQVRKDIINACRCLTYNGAIVIHDINPATKEAQEVPCRASIWNGDVWRAWVGIKKDWVDVKTEAYRFDHGIGVIYPNGGKIYSDFEEKDMTYEKFDQTRDKWL